MPARFAFCVPAVLVRALVTAAVVLGAMLAGAAAEGNDFPAARLPAAPSPAPDFPAEFLPFEPPQDLAAPGAGAPSLAEWNRTARPGDTFMVTGSALSAPGTTPAGSDTSFVVFAQAGQQKVTAPAAIQRLSGDRAALTLPQTLPARSLFLVWPRNAVGLGRPAILNQTEAWWIGPDLVTRRERFSIYGRNLTPTATERRSWLYLRAASGEGRWLRSATANPYRADFYLPADVADGAYQVWAHNGLGGPLGWSGPLSFTVDAGIVWSSREFNVRSFGAKGDGKADDLIPIATALNAAAAEPGSTVYFPPGRYAISDSLTNIAPQTRLRGAGMNLSRIVARNGYSANGHGLIYGSLNRVEIRDLAFDTAGVLDALLGNNLLHIRGSSRVTLTRLLLTQELDYTESDGAPIDLHQCERVQIRGCEFRASGGVFLGTSRQIFFDTCKFRGLNDLGAFIYIWGGTETAISGCSAADYDSRDSNNGHGWCQGRFLAGLGKWAANRDIYFGQNRTTNLTVRPTHSEQNTGEQFMFEGLDTFIRGTPDRVGPDWVEFDALTEDYTGRILVIVSGAGVGQSRQITSFTRTGGRLTVDAPWTTPPDSTSTIVVGHYMSRMAVYGNYLTGKPRAVTSQNHIASSGIQPFGGCVELVAARNVIKRTRAGIANWSMTNRFGDDQVLQPNFFNEFLDNQLLGCRQGVLNLLARWEPRPTLDDPGILGNLFRGNRMAGLADSTFVYQTWDGPAAVHMTVFDKNTASSASSAVIGDNGGVRDQVWTGNNFRGRGTAITLAATHRPALRDNLWTGFTPVYSGEPVGGVLEVPFRTSSVTAPAGRSVRGTVQIWNSGTAPLTWTASSDQPWLKIAEPTGIVAGERSLGRLHFTADATALPPGERTAVIRLAAGAQEQRVTVSLRVTP